MACRHSQSQRFRASSPISFITHVNRLLQSSYMRTVLMPALYETVVLRSSRHCRNTLKMLAARPDVCRLIKKLAVRPNYYLAWPRPNEAISEAWVASTIMQIAGGMSRLQTFDWDGLEMPTDQLWATLKAKCVHWQLLCYPRTPIPPIQMPSVTNSVYEHRAKPSGS